MTANQIRLLEILETWGGMGTIEVEIQFGEYAPDTDREDDTSGFRKTRLVVSALMRTLVRRGLASIESGYDITERGRDYLTRLRAANKKSPKPEFLHVVQWADGQKDVCRLTREYAPGEKVWLEWAKEFVEVVHYCRPKKECK